MTRWSLFLQTLSLLHHFLGLYLEKGVTGDVLALRTSSDTVVRVLEVLFVLLALVVLFTAAV